MATPDHWHKRMVIEALEAGKDVYCEKPLTYAVDEGLEIAKAVKRSGKLLQVGSQGMSGGNQQKVREWVRSGRLGQVTMIRASYNRNSASGSWLYPIPPDASPKPLTGKLFWGRPLLMNSISSGFSAGAATAITPAASRPIYSSISARRFIS